MSGAPIVEVMATTHTCGCHIATTEAGYVAEVEYCDEGRLLAARLHRSRLHRRSLPFESTRLMDALTEVERHEKTLERHRLFAGPLTILRRTSDPACLPKDGFLRPQGGVRLTRARQTTRSNIHPQAPRRRLPGRGSRRAGTASRLRGPGNSGLERLPARPGSHRRRRPTRAARRPPERPRRRTRHGPRPRGGWRTPDRGALPRSRLVLGLRPRRGRSTRQIPRR